ncbi:MAG: ATP-binding cassette domain-containing protein [Mycoplasmatales bacterium]|nr:ATP-binding cassette domain-containing protein [Mycoplasmatales bacterium]
MKMSNLSLIDGEFVILDNLNIEIIPNKFNVIFGENGAGKTSLLECLVNIRKDYSGMVDFTKRISFYEAHPDFDGSMKVKDFLELAFIASMDQSNNIAAEVSRVLKTYNLMHISKSKLKSLSSGQKRLVYIISKLKEESDVLIFDEPTANLDPAMRDFIFSEINNFKNIGKTVIVCTHLTNEISKYIDVLTIISGGKVHYNGPYNKTIVDDFFVGRKILSDIKKGNE